MHYMQVCERCGQQWVNAHFCPELNKGIWFPTVPEPKPLTESDVRRIVREELAKATKGGEHGKD